MEQERPSRSAQEFSYSQERGTMSMRAIHAWRIPAILAGCAMLASNAFAQLGGITKEKQGKGGSVVQGAAGTQGSQGDTGLQHCDKPMGALAVVEPQDFVLQSLRQYKLQSPVSLIRLMVQQSNCFIVVERGVGMQNAMQERALNNSGELRDNSNMGKGQMVTADFILTPSVIFSENNAGGVGGAAAGVFGGKFGALAGGLKFKEAQTSMLVADARSTVQVAAAEGSTKKADLRLGGAFFGGGVGAAAGGYGNTKGVAYQHHEVFRRIEFCRQVFRMSLELKVSSLDVMFVDWSCDKHIDFIVGKISCCGFNRFQCKLS